MNPVNLQKHQQQQLQKAVQQIPVEVCPVCTSTQFVQTVTLRKMPALMSPNGQPGLAVTQVGYVCAYCNWQWNPEGMVQQAENIATGDIEELPEG